MAKKKASWRRKVVIGLIVAVVASAGYTTWAVRTISSTADGRVFTNAADVPHHRVALVLGTAPKMADGRNNLYFTGRMVAAARLYKSGKVDKLLVSGDNSREGYDEPTAMKNALIARGVPATDIVADFAGLRTLDSIVRAHKVFGLNDLVIVTDDFHLPRAIYLADHEGVAAVGYQTDPVPVSESMNRKQWIREIGARALLFMDIYVLNRQPKFLGKRESI